jgi:hypothetical protein
MDDTLTGIVLIQLGVLDIDAAAPVIFGAVVASICVMLVWYLCNSRKEKI